jgi:hypothetical protein
VRNVSDKGSRENKSHILSSITFFSFENIAAFVVMWKSTVEPDRKNTLEPYRPQMTI